MGLLRYLVARGPGSYVHNLAEKSKITGIVTDQQCIDHYIKLETSNKVKGPRGYNRWECNLAAVWGQVSTGGGHTPLMETMSVLGVPVMTKGNYASTERGLGEWRRSQFEKSCLESGAEEKKLAIERGDYHQGVPAITVVVDGGWSKWSHKHSYNAKSGVAIIIGQAMFSLVCATSTALHVQM